MKYIEALCLIAVTIALCWFLNQARLLLEHADANVTMLAKQASGTLGHVDAVASRADAGVAQLNSATAGELSTLARTNREVLKASADLHDLLAHSDLTLNGTAEHPGAIPELTAALASTNALVADTSRNMNATFARLEPGIDAFTKDASDPAIHETLANAGEMTKQSAIVTTNLALTTHDLQQWVHRETTPIRGTWNLIKATLRDFAGPAAQVATAAK